MLEDNGQAERAIERKFPGWTVSRYLGSGKPRGFEVPAGHYCAVHERLSEIPIVAPDLDTLSAAIQTRNDELEAARQWAERSSLHWLTPWRLKQ